jgi:cellulose synthase/poly-beta-1,6-N-acetylglucosamine synthase-like glycosyltransferase
LWSIKLQVEESALQIVIVLLQVYFVFVSCLIVAYLIRHYVFTFAVLRNSKKPKTTYCSPLKTAFEPSVTILVPAHNEEHVIGKMIQEISHLTYPKNKLQVIIIDDASTDNTGQIADECSKNLSFVKIIHRNKRDGGKGKAAALNTALKISTGEIILCFDADYLPQQDIVQKLIQPFCDPLVGAVQGRPVVLNEPDNLITRMIALERISGYRVDQEARDILGLIPQFGGTVGGFRKSIIDDLHGFDAKMLAEDTDLTFSICLKGFKVRYVGEAECYEEAVDSWRAYWRQRHRWARGHMQVCFKHALNVLKSRKLNLKEKVDGLLLLAIYFLPVLSLFSLLLAVPFVLYSDSVFSAALWFFIPVSLYSFVGNFAPFFEVGIGAYLDGRKQLQWLAPLLIFAFLYNILICTKALIDVTIGIVRGQQGNWAKTTHSGKGKSYIQN